MGARARKNVDHSFPHEHRIILVLLCGLIAKEVSPNDVAYGAAPYRAIGKLRYVVVQPAQALPLDLPFFVVVSEVIVLCDLRGRCPKRRTTATENACAN